MSDFPKGGDVEATRVWLNEKGFYGHFPNYAADSLLGQEKSDIIETLGKDEGLRLWGLLNTAKQNQSHRVESMPSNPPPPTGIAFILFLTFLIFTVIFPFVLQIIKNWFCLLLRPCL
jgi:hypothetical protein